MSKAASNMMGKLVSLELQGKALVGIFHPGFNRTDMTSKYSDIWDEEGAVDPSGELDGFSSLLPTPWSLFDGFCSWHSHCRDLQIPFVCVMNSVGAKRVLHEVNVLTAETSGQFINCEDGKQIPW